MKTLRVILLAVAMTAAVPLGVALADVLECTMDPGSNNAYVAPKIRIDYDAFKTARVSDSVIASTDLTHVEGTVEKETDAMIRFFWVVKGVNLEGRDIVNSYRRHFDLMARLTVKRSDGTAVLSQSDTRGYIGNFIQATGQCRNVD